MQQLLLAAALQSGAAYTVVQDRDISDNNKLGYGPGNSALDCAQQCAAKYNCVAVSWNAPLSKIHDMNCNFKCKADTLVVDKGEQVVIVHKGENRCNVPPPPIRSNCSDATIPADWLPRCLAAELFFRPSIHTISNAATATAGVLMPEIGNGYVGTIQDSGVIHAGGLFNGDAHGKFGEASHRATIPHFIVEWTATSSSSSSSSAQPQISALDIGRAVFFKRSVMAGGINVEERYYAHATRPSLLVHDITFDAISSTAAGSTSITFTHRAMRTTDTLNLTAFADASLGYAVTGHNNVAEDAIIDATDGNRTTLAVVANAAPSTLIVKKGETKTLLFVQSIVTSLNSSDPKTDALDALASAVATSPSDLLTEHLAAWEARNLRGSLAVEGDLRLAQALNASLYSLRASIRSDFSYGLSPGGLTTDGYKGHTFWDQETWMWPPLLFLDPPSAASALHYRFQRLGAAAENAAKCGANTTEGSYCPRTYTPGSGTNRAIQFPWESAVTGKETQWNEPKTIGKWGKYEIHISGDVSFAARQFFYQTGDETWLKDIGFPLINGVANFYANRLPTGGTEMLEVMGPDEFAVPINGSAYTDNVAKIAIDGAIEFAKILGLTVPSDFAIKAEALQIKTAPVPPGSNLTGVYHPEYDGYPNKKGGALVKQADTVMLRYPFGVEMDTATLENDLTWYEPHTDVNGPAMTWSIFAIGWFDTGDYVRSRELFQKGFQRNVHPPFNVWTETLGGGCTPFLTGAGGFLQSVVFGTSGMRLLSDRITFNPPPPSATGGTATSISMRFNYQRAMLYQTVTQDTVEFGVLLLRVPGEGTGEAAPPATALVLVKADGSKVPLVAGKGITVPRTGGLAIMVAT